METSGHTSDSPPSSATNSNNSSPGNAFQFTASNFFRSPMSSFLEYSGVLHNYPHYNSLNAPSPRLDDSTLGVSTPQSSASNSSSNGEVSIRIISAGEQEENNILQTASPSPVIHHVASTTAATTTDQELEHSISTTASVVSLPSAALNIHTNSTADPSSTENDPVNASPNAQPTNAAGHNQNTESSYQRYDIHQAARLIEQVLPFSLLLLLVLIRQHLEGFFVTIWVAAFMFKSNDILRKQTALKGERRHSTLFGISFLFTLHVIILYWWYWTDLSYSLVMFPPKATPPFWHAIFIIMVNDALVRQTAMVIKCSILMYYKNSRGRSYRRQGQMLTLVEYFVLLYRALLPAPVWYSFFGNKEYGSLFSSLVAGLYLTFKLLSIVEKVQYLFTSLKALCRTEIQYGTYATAEQVSAAGDLCAICQEKMDAPILLRCNHIFCEDCVSEWFERERTCPLCRAVVKSAELRSFADGSTSLFFQLS
ncbi:RING finger and transmembrane domain-containing protein 2 [Heracleum sosnowskyi]|uniref:RING finger and transmembrane domain-containing protein 2 n=1 Tax=Heracleum sosnowskyi TaxID=360622 RepID=A0AAD8M0T3_9APIA|nr:RING finger and transmembrane domain-containing protein 2 [Heracleum sosnowskyi]